MNYFYQLIGIDNLYYSFDRTRIIDHNYDPILLYFAKKVHVIVLFALKTMLDYFISASDQPRIKR